MTDISTNENDCVSLTSKENTETINYIKKGMHDYKYLDYTTFLDSQKFNHRSIQVNYSKEVHDEVKQCGVLLEEELKKQDVKFPTQLPLYDLQSDHLNTSSLKNKRRFFQIMNILTKHYIYRKQNLSKSCIEGYLHECIFDNVSSTLNCFDKCDQKKLNITDLHMDKRITNFLLKHRIPNFITGTADFIYKTTKGDIIPIELKTIYELDIQSPYYIKKLYKKLNQYITQLCMYQQMWKTKTIWLLLVCRKTFRFTIIPFETSGHFNIIQSKFNYWMNDFIKYF